MSDSNYKPSGELQGDTKAMPDRGTRTGMNGDAMGADVSQDACNCQGGISGATGSDPHGQCKSSPKPRA